MATLGFTSQNDVSFQRKWIDFCNKKWEVPCTMARKKKTALKLVNLSSHLHHFPNQGNPR